MNGCASENVFTQDRAATHGFEKETGMIPATHTDSDPYFVKKVGAL